MLRPGGPAHRGTFARYTSGSPPVRAAAPSIRRSLDRETRGRIPCGKNPEIPEGPGGAVSGPGLGGFDGESEGARRKIPVGPATASTGWCGSRRGRSGTARRWCTSFHRGRDRLRRGRHDRCHPALQRVAEDPRDRAGGSPDVRPEGHALPGGPLHLHPLAHHKIEEPGLPPIEDHIAVAVDFSHDLFGHHPGDRVPEALLDLRVSYFHGRRPEGTTARGRSTGAGRSGPQS